MEAMAAGVPVVSTRVSGIPELESESSARSIVHCLARSGGPKGRAQRRCHAFAVLRRRPALRRGRHRRTWCPRAAAGAEGLAAQRRALEYRRLHCASGWMSSVPRPSASPAILAFQRLEPFASPTSSSPYFDFHRKKDDVPPLAPSGPLSFGSQTRSAVDLTIDGRSNPIEPRKLTPARLWDAF
jgi:hypothetical protein